MIDSISINTKAKILMMCSALSFSIMAAIVKTSPYSAELNAFFRQIFSSLAIFTFIKITKLKIIPRRENWSKLIFRSIFGTIGIYFYFIAINTLLLANASFLTRLSPFFVIVFAFVILKEKIEPSKWLIFLPMILGSMFIIKPNTNVFNFNSLYAIVSAFFGALAYTMIKLIGKKESPYTIIFWFSTISSILFLLISFNELITIKNLDLIKMTCIGIFGVLGQIGLTISYQISKASDVAPYSYLYVIFSSLLGYLIWNEVPDYLSIIGFLLIILAYFSLLYRDKK